MYRVFHDFICLVLGTPDGEELPRRVVVRGIVITLVAFVLLAVLMVSG